MDKLPIRFESIEEGVESLNSLLDSNESDIALLRLHFNSTRYRGRSFNDETVIYLFKPNGDAKFAESFNYDNSKILIPSKGYFLKNNSEWSSMIIADNIVIPARFMHNFGLIDGSLTHLTTPWRGSDLLIKNDLEKYVSEQFKNSIAFSKRYDKLYNLN